MAVGRADFFTGVVMRGDRIWSSEAICSLSHRRRPSAVGQNEGNTQREAGQKETETDRETRGKDAH